MSINSKGLEPSEGPAEGSICVQQSWNFYDSLQVIEVVVFNDSCGICNIQTFRNKPKERVG